MGWSLPAVGLYFTDKATLNGTTAGGLIWQWLDSGEGGWKQLVGILDGYENTTATAQTLTFPTAFTYEPEFAQQPTSFGATADSTTLTLPASMSATVTGLLVVEGF